MAGLAEEKFPLVHRGGDGDVEKANHHFVVGPLAPGDGAVGIGVVDIVGRVVVPGDGLELGSGLDAAGLGKPVAQLPVKIVIHTQEYFGRVVRADEAVFEALPPQMHVWEEAEQGRIVGEVPRTSTR